MTPEESREMAKLVNFDPSFLELSLINQLSIRKEIGKKIHTVADLIKEVERRMK